jgi:hypothetical protein
MHRNQIHLVLTSAGGPGDGGVSQFEEVYCKSKWPPGDGIRENVGSGGPGPSRKLPEELSKHDLERISEIGYRNSTRFRCIRDPIAFAFPHSNGDIRLKTIKYKSCWLSWLLGILVTGNCLLSTGCATNSVAEKPPTLKEWGQWSRPRI